MLLSSADDSYTCAVLRAMQLKLRAPPACTAGRILIMVRFITPGVLHAAVPNSWLDCAVVQAAAAVGSGPSLGDALMVWLSQEARELLVYARVGSIFSLDPSQCESVQPAAHKTFKLELHSPLLLQLEGWMPVCLSAFVLDWFQLKMVKAPQQSVLRGADDVQPTVTLGALQSACRLTDPLVRTLSSVQSLPGDYNLVSCVCTVNSFYQNWVEHELVLECRDLSDEELKCIQHMLLDYSLPTAAAPSSSARCTTVTIKLDRLAVPPLLTPGCAIVLYRFWQRRTPRGVFIKCSAVAHVELLLPADWMPAAAAPRQQSATRGDSKPAVPSSSFHLLDSPAIPFTVGDLNRWQHTGSCGGVDTASSSWQYELPCEQPMRLMDLRRNPSAVADVVASIVAVKSVSACFQCSVCSCVAAAGRAYLPSDSVLTATSCDRRRADQDSLVKTREMRCSRCRLSRMALFAAKCHVQLDDGTGCAAAHAPTTALFQAMLGLSPVALERLADLVSHEGAMQLLCGKKQMERQQHAERVSAASKTLAEMCVCFCDYRSAQCAPCLYLSAAACPPEFTAEYT
jgi:hypothetical protein